MSQTVFDVATSVTAVSPLFLASGRMVAHDLFSAVLAARCLPNSHDT